MSGDTGTTDGASVTGTSLARSLRADGGLTQGRWGATNSLKTTRAGHWNFPCWPDGQNGRTCPSIQQSQHPEGPRGAKLRLGGGWRPPNPKYVGPKSNEEDARCMFSAARKSFPVASPGQRLRQNLTDRRRRRGSGVEAMGHG